MGNRSSDAGLRAVNRGAQRTAQSHEAEDGRPEADEEESYDVEEAKEAEEDASCCGGATCCNASLRYISVNEPVSSCLSERITWSSLFWLATIIFITAMTWATMYFLIGDAMLPGEPLYGLFFLVIASYALGWSLAYVPYLNLPPVFGMLLAGIIFRNTGLYDIQEKIGLVPTAKIRTFCLTFVTLRAGLQMTTTPLRNHPVFLFALALIPSTVETIVVAVCSRYILRYPWDWAFLRVVFSGWGDVANEPVAASLCYRSIIAGMSPVVTVNCILALADRGYGEDKGMATLLCTAAAIDDVHIVSLYSVCFSIVFSVATVGSEWWTYIPGGLRDLLLGFIVGFILGTIFVFIPHRTAKYVSWYRLGGLIIGSLMCTTAASTIGITGGGYLATVIMAFLATTGWRLTAAKFDVTPLRKAIFFIWHFMQPILVGVIGADIDFANWTAGRFGLYASCILIGLVGRSLSAVMSCYGTPFNLKERIFVALAWLPKGTLQAAFAPMAYEQARLENDPARIELALDIVRISVVAIIFMAPLGAIIMTLSGPLLLNKITGEEVRRHRLLSWLRMTRQLQPVRRQKILDARRRGENTDATGGENNVQQASTNERPIQ